MVGGFIKSVYFLLWLWLGSQMRSIVLCKLSSVSNLIFNVFQTYNPTFLKLMTTHQ